MIVKILITPEGKTPVYASNGAAGADIYSANTVPIAIRPRERKLIPTGIYMDLPQGFEAQIRSRSGLALKEGIVVLNSPGTIDSDYRGEINVILINHGDSTFIVQPKMRIAQMVIAPAIRVMFEEVTNITNTERGSSGFGSTGKE